MGLKSIQSTKNRAVTTQQLQAPRHLMCLLLDDGGATIAQDQEQMDDNR